jgi:hypothetical protein
MAAGGTSDANSSVTGAMTATADQPEANRQDTIAGFGAADPAGITGI